MYNTFIINETEDNMREIDLHVHTNISDGSETPEATVKYAKELGLRAIAVTDHDNVGGITAAKAAGEKYGLEVVGGLELGCGWYGKEVHMLAYDVDINDKWLRAHLGWIITDRHERNEKMAKLISDDGIRIDLAELEKRYKGSSIGRPHFAVALVEQGLATDVQDAFHRFLDPGCKYYIRRSFLSVEEAAEMIRGAGGKPVIAHPGQYRLTEERMTELMQRSEKAGVAGLECYYSGYGEKQVAEYLAYAEKYGFCATAGSDWHGKHKPHIQLGSGMNGELSAPYELLRKLREHD